MKILHIIGLAHGGAGQHVLDLASACDPRRFEVTVAMADSSPMLPAFERSGVRVVPLELDHFGGVTKNVLALRQLSRLMKTEPFDVVHTHTSVAGVLGRLAARLHTRAQVVHMLHAFAAHPYRSLPFKLGAHFIERRLDRLTDWYIASTRSMVEHGVGQRVFAADKVALIPCGIDLAPFRLAGLVGRHDAPPAEASHLEPAAVTIGFLGRLEKQKGVEYLIRAVPLVRRRNPRTRFVVAGDGRLRPKLERLAAGLGVSDAVEFVGWRSDIAEFLKGIDLMAMPSLWESFGLSAAEAMAMEKPVVASRVQGLPEVIEDGVTGLLVPPADAAALARAIVDLASDPARRRWMGHRGRERVEANFTTDLMVERHEAFYERIKTRRAGAVPADHLERTRNLALSLSEPAEGEPVPD